ncbi:MAG: lipocalin family protein [Acidobacteriota bacterium]|nr:lipocalin family protein [Acidobacteriota bacterium]
MKKIIRTAFLLSLFVFSGNVFAQSKSSGKQAPPPTVAVVNLKQYAGKWYEIARYPNKFQKKCVGNTTATYTLKPDGNIGVFNQCLIKNGTLDGATGEAKIVEGSSNAKLEVRFAPKFTSFLSAVWGDYWIVDLDNEYKYAAVGDPKREYLWILSRTPEMTDATYQNILRRVEKLGFNPAKLQKTPQNAEAIKGAVVRKQQK